ncbi:MAG: sulfite exporter TauE/SafE family protein [Planctomycetota bacterium]|jgi:sulfite exporter TauE/SafE
MQEFTVITITAASIGLFHTLLGPDHYLPFTVMAQARKWSLIRTICITAVCGIGHVLSSVVLGIIGIALGISLNKLGAIESFRGGLAAWLLIVFGLGYFIWGVFRARKNLPHKHWHAHGDVSMPIHKHKHKHGKDQLHIHKGEKAKNLTPWILFTIFVFGPCEPLIPLLIYPAAKSSTFGLVLVTGVFGVVTIATMLSIVILLYLGANLLPMGRLERYTHALAGATICICGIAIRFLGL